MNKLTTQLPESITTIDQAKKLLTDLYNNGESFHPEDDANDCLEGKATPIECDWLNKLMEDIYNLEGNQDIQNMVLDPCGFLLELDPAYQIQSVINGIEEAFPDLSQDEGSYQYEWIQKLKSILVR